jgi:hypothetical protein
MEAHLGREGESPPCLKPLIRLSPEPVFDCHSMNMTATCRISFSENLGIPRPYQGFVN